MSDPDTIRANIEMTRTHLGTDVDALAEKVSPSSIAERQKEKVKGTLRSAQESVMGVAQSAKDALPDAGSAGAAKESAIGTAKGHPIAVGLIALGAGWLLSSLIPTAAAEKDLASSVKEKAAPLVDAAKDAARDTAQQLKEPAMSAASHVKDTAQDAATTVQAEGRSAAADVRDTAQDAKDDVAGAAADQS